MILSKYFWELKEKLDAFLKEAESLRSKTFFPIYLDVEYPNPDYDVKYHQEHYYEYDNPKCKPFITKPAMAQPQYHFHASPLCCGLMEISSTAVNKASWVYNIRIPLEGKALLDKHGLGAVPINTLYFIDLLCLYTKAHANRGLMLYTAPPKGGYEVTITELARLGFTKLLDFANPAHENHQVTLYACHTPTASEAWGRGSIKWPDGNAMKVVRDVAAKTISGSMTTKAVGVGVATGGLPRLRLDEFEG